MEALKSLSDLLDLQNVDLDIDRLLDRRQSLPELDEYRAASDHASSAQDRLSDLEEELHETDLAVDKAEGEFEIREDKLKLTEQRLFAGGMNARETENMRLEVEGLRRQHSEYETEVLEGLDDKEQIQARVEAARGELRELEEKKAQLESKIKEEWKVIDAQVARREATKADLVPTIAPDLITLYEQLRQSKEGQAVGRLEDGVCGGCHLQLSAAELRQAMRVDPPRCTHCRRILVP